jgi:hypothetical protein
MFSLDLDKLEFGIEFSKAGDLFYCLNIVFKHTKNSFFIHLKPTK